MNETSKAMRRRYQEDKTNVFPWWSLFQGEGLDIGSGPNKLMFPGCKPFDIEQGDANRLTDHVPTESLDYIHSSQCLEHMLNPHQALEEWLACLRPGGHAIITVPDWCLYERMIWPSRFNPDHRSTWSMWMKGSEAPLHIYVPDLMIDINHLAACKLCRVVDTNYRYDYPENIDQTWVEADGVEAFIEFVLQKRK